MVQIFHPFSSDSHLAQYGINAVVSGIIVDAGKRRLRSGELKMKTFPIRLHPGEDLKQSLVVHTAQNHIRAGLILTCVGSLRPAALRMANQSETSVLGEKFEIVSLVGTLGPDGPHLHLSISDSTGKTIGGHLQEGSLIYTTAEIVVAELEDWVFSRVIDPETTFDELVPIKRA
jgi:predicted DNA-binding protein with PD1-like motif